VAPGATLLLEDTLAAACAIVKPIWVRRRLQRVNVESQCVELFVAFGARENLPTSAFQK
jgi:hypothetical protein